MQGKPTRLAGTLIAALSGAMWSRGATETQDEAQIRRINTAKEAAARLASYEAALREIAAIKAADRVESGMAEDMANIARKALEDK